MSIKKLTEAFKKDANIHRSAHPIPPSPDILNQLDETRRVQFLDEWEEEYNKSLHDNNVSFENAIIRIKLCAFLRGFIHSTGAPQYIKHYTWCPHDEWAPDMFKNLENLNKIPEEE